ncbi:MAG: D-isomer specific 2-hydroxyacid dehydrogenase family protein [Acidimicrobiales bacterium]
MSDGRPRIAVEPPCWRRDALVAAVEAGGGEVVALDEATALVWADPQAPELLPEHTHAGIDWVQLPYAGIEPFIDLLDRDRVWTCGKGVYTRPVAEHILALALAAFHNLGPYSAASEWSGPVGRNLFGSRVLLLGGGGITTDLLELLAPFDTHNVVLRRVPEALDGADHVGTLDDLHAELPQADLVVLALAVTPQTIGVIGAHELGLIGPDSWLINLARGVHVDTDALVEALENGAIGGACLDVTDPEPLPQGHPLWSFDNCIITPHVGNTPEMGLELLADRVTENTGLYARGDPLIGPVDLDLGY